MADAKEGPKPAGIDTMIETLFVLIFVIALLNRIPVLIQEKTGIDPFDIRGSYSRLRDVNENTPLGSMVGLRKGSEIFETPGFGRIIGFQEKGAEGILERGPETALDGRWWYVDFSRGDDGWVAEDTLENSSFTKRERTIKWTLYTLATVLIVGLFSLVIFLTIRINKIRAGDMRRVRKIQAEAIAEKQQKMETRNPRWDRVLSEVASDNPNDWRQAILEADIMLDEMVTQLGYIGDSLGEKLRSIPSSGFRTIDDAWNAHRVRNQIAHAGSDLVLDKRQALHTIELYRRVFEEFEYI